MLGATCFVTACVLKARDVPGKRYFKNEEKVQ